MHAFTRLTSFLLFVLSLGLFTSALPTSVDSGSNGLVARTDYGQQMLDICLALEVKVDAQVTALDGCGTVSEVKTHVKLIVAGINAAAEAFFAVGAKVEIDADIKAQVAAKVAAIIVLIVQACLRVSLKFGLVVVLSVFAQIDVCVKLLLVNLGICIEGIVEIIAKIVIAACGDAIVKLHFNLCTSVFGIVAL